MSGEVHSKRDVLGIVISVLVLAIIVIHPTSWAFPLEWLARLLGLDEDAARKAPHLAVADILIWIAGALLFLRIILRGEWRRLKGLSPAGVLLAALAVASMAFAGNKLSAVAEVVQYVEYFVVLYLLFVTVLTTAERVSVAASIWLAVGSVVAVWGLVHYLSDPRSVLDVNVSGPFDNRNLFSGYLAMLLPLAWGLMVHSRKWMVYVQSLALIGVGLVTMLAGGPWLAALIGMGVISFVRSPKLFPIFAAAALLLLISYSGRLPRDNPGILAKSVEFFDEQRQTGETVPNDKLTEKERFSPRYVRWQAAMKFLTLGIRRELPITRSENVRQLLLGVGVGNYQDRIGSFRGSLPKPNKKDNDEADTNNLYLVMAMSMGLPAVFVFLWLVGGLIRRSAAGYLATEDPFLKGLLLGCVGALASLLVTNLFTETLVRGSGPAMILLFALAAAGATLAERKPSASE